MIQLPKRNDENERNSREAADLFTGEAFQTSSHRCLQQNRALYNPTRDGFLLPVYNLRYLILPKEKKILRVQWNDQLVEEDLHPFST